jgi:hypothetical protein
LLDNLQETFMRIMHLATLSAVLAVAVGSPRYASAQVSATIRLGTPLAVSAYSSSTHGEWATNYRKWTPTTVYVYNGKYYPRAVKGSHAVQIYRHGKEYFTPPRDDAWRKGADKRFNYKRVPSDDDYSHADGHRP